MADDLYTLILLALTFLPIPALPQQQPGRQPHGVATCNRPSPGQIQLPDGSRQGRLD